MIMTMTKMLNQILGKFLRQKRLRETTREVVVEGYLAKVAEGEGGDFGDVVEEGGAVGGEGGAVVGGEGEGRGEVEVVKLLRGLSAKSGIILFVFFGSLIKYMYNNYYLTLLYLL